MKNVLKGQFNLSYTGFNLRYSLYNKYKKKTSGNIRILFNKISDYLSNWSFWYTNYQIPPPILIIDEENLFIGYEHKDKVFFKTILNWFVLNSKER